MVLLLPSKSFDFICFKQCLPFSVSGVVKEQLKSWQMSGMSPPLAEVEFQDSPAVRSSSSGWWFHPYLVKWSNLTNVFQMGWNHQVVMIWSHDLMIHQCFLADVLGSRPSTRVPNSARNQVTRHPHKKDCTCGRGDGERNDAPTWKWMDDIATWNAGDQHHWYQCGT